jgi:methylmalonyl-CoA/ethylmalonyl-CoA epimerase
MDLANATVGQLLVSVENLETAVPFYRDILGLQHLFSAPPQMAFFQCGYVRLLVGVLPAGQTAQRGAAIYFQVPDIHGVFQTLTERGVKFVAAPHVVQRTPGSELWLAEFTDPDGNQLALMSQATTGARDPVQ